MEEVGQSVVNIWRQLRLRESPLNNFFSKRVYIFTLDICRDVKSALLSSITE
jgi:hypothetical protein